MNKNEDLKNAIDYLKLKANGKLNDPDVLLKLAKKLGIKTERRVRGKLISIRGKVWIKTIQAEIIEKAVLKKKNKEIKENATLKKLLPKKQIKSVKLVDRVGAYSNYHLNIINPDNELSVLHEELMEFIETLPFASVVFLILIFREIGTNRLRHYSVRQSNFETLEELEEHIYNIFDGEVEGSDAVDKNNFELIYQAFGVNTFSAVGYGDERCMFWETEDIQSKGNCGDKCLEFCGFTPTIKVKDFGVMVKLIEDNHLKIRVVKNTPSLDYKSYYEKIKVLPFTYEKITHFNKKQVEIKKVYILNNLDYNYQVVRESEDFDYTIIFCENGRHFSVAKNNVMNLKPNVFIDLRESIIGNDEVGLLYKFNQICFYNTPSNKVSITSKLHYVFFDLETIVDWDYANCMKPYSLSICCLDEIQLEQLEKYDRANDKEACESMRERFAKTWIGYDCVENFLLWIVENQSNKKFKFVGFNNSNFDNFFILQTLMKGFGVGDLFIELKESKLFFSGSSLNNFTINKRHSFFDLRKHLVGSLANNCKSWGVNVCSKLSFNHNDAQQIYDENPQKLIDWCNESDTLKKYNEFDTISVAVILQKYKIELNSIPCVKQVLDEVGEGKNMEQNYEVNDITTIGTIGSLIYKVFQRECRENEITFGMLDRFKYDELQRCKIAGRVEMFNGVQHIKKKYASIDVCSLYPYVLAVKDVYYPSGKIIEVKSFQGFEKLVFIGFRLIKKI